MLIYLVEVLRNVYECKRLTEVRAMNRSDPYDLPDEHIFECRQCGTHLQTTERVETCSECGGVVRNITVPRE
jgi:rubrerythrin